MEDEQILHQEFGNLGLNQKDYKDILQGYQKIEIKKGEYLIKSGTVVKAYYFVIQGFLRSFAIDYNGNEVTTNFYKKGDLVLEENSFFMQMPTKEFIQATEDCTLWMKDVATFNIHFNVYEQYREWGRAHLVHNFFSLKQRTLSMLTDKASDRYLDLLKNNPEVFQKVSLKHIASFLGITDSSLSRIRKETSKK